jgi:hypothetical protein
MNSGSAEAILDFEAYLLMTMKLRITMAGKVALLEAKLAEHGLSVDDAAAIHHRVTEALSDEAGRFETTKNLLGIADPASASLEYSSLLWPGFDFKAIADHDGLLESARYRRITSDSPNVDSPSELPTWSVDVPQFSKHFGPLTIAGRWSLFDKYLPAYEEYEFEWNGERYGARFLWGLFLSSSMYWD